MAASAIEKLAKSFERLGWVSFWIQIALAIIPVLMLVYAVSSLAMGWLGAFGFANYLAFFGLAVLVFTTLWSLRYVRVGKRMRDPELRPTRKRVSSVLWIGFWASSVGILVSVASLLIHVVTLLILLLRAPQGGVPVIRTEADDRTGWVSAIDAVGLLAELSTLIGELMVLGITLWLMFRLLKLGEEYDKT